MIKLYSTYYCPYALRTRIVLAEKKIEHEHHEIDLKNKPADFLDISPYGKVPVLIDGDTRVYESAVINEYLDEKYPEPSLMPPTPEGRAYVRIWIDYANTRLMPAGFRARRATEEKRAEAMKEFLDCLGTMEKEIDGKLYLAGEQYTLADAAFAPVFAALRKEEGFDWDAFPNLDAWFERISARPSYAQTGELEPPE
ncbi:MAG: glutathione S-transferase family protein [Myxococcota bacterium]